MTGAYGQRSAAKDANSTAVLWRCVSYQFSCLYLASFGAFRTLLTTEHTVLAALRPSGPHDTINAAASLMLSVTSTAGSCGVVSGTAGELLEGTGDAAGGGVLS